ncbi:MAG: hypothetical protein HUJ70_02520 [Pseudobutyrivibrio sp.]|nr:hypothetical protein [Pseudobutyrivibrio sp.]
MFFNEKELKAAKQLAWELIDGWNHSYLPNPDDYPHFYFKGKMVLDPWMNEKSQDLSWPDHENAECAVDPVEYYGERTIENYLTWLFLRWPDEYPETVARIRESLDENGRLRYMGSGMPMEVYVAMSEEQAEEEHGFTCLEKPLPDSDRIYIEMGRLPEDIFQVVKLDWECEVTFRKKDAKKAIKYLYPQGCAVDITRLINRVNGETIRLIGFGD